MAAGHVEDGAAALESMSSSATHIPTRNPGGSVIMWNASEWASCWLPGG